MNAKAPCSFAASLATAATFVVALVATPDRASAYTIPHPFGYAGQAATWTVPPGVTRLLVELAGAEGGYAAGDPYGGARGGTTRAIVTVTPGETLQINVGGRGVLASGATSNIPGLGGWNGGGSGGTGGAGDCGPQPAGSGGGGATDIRRAPYGLANRLVVAAGGGGSNGGAGGGPQGEDAFLSGAGGAGKPGKGGNTTTQTGGALGAGGTNESLPPGGAGTAGTSGSGGAGGAGGHSNGIFQCEGRGGGGGGGGYFGGGGGGGGAVMSGTQGGSGGAGAGGGGGSGFGPAGAVSRSGENDGHGSAVLTPVSVPRAPIIGTTSEATSGQAHVHWTHGYSDGVLPLTGFTVTSTPGNITKTVQVLPSTEEQTTSAIVTGLTNGVTYTFTVHATNDVGNGPESAASNAVTPATKPDAPIIGTAVAGDEEVAVYFTPPAFDGGLPISAYTAVAQPGPIYHHVDTNSVDWDDVLTNHRIVFAPLTNGTTYTFRVYASGPWGDSPLSAASNAVTPSGTPIFAVNDVSVTEGNAGTSVAAFTITRSGNTTASSSVKYATADGTATAPADYTALASTASFAAGQTTKVVNVAVKGDYVAEANETLHLVLSAPVNATIGDGSGTATIVNDDSSAPPTFFIGDAPLAEGDTGTKAAVFTITRTGNLASAASVKYRTVNGTAAAPGDYTALAPTAALSFAVGVSSKTVSVAVKGDYVAEANETFTVELYSPVGASITRTAGIGTIINNDSPDAPSFVVNDVSIGEGNSGTRLLVFTVTRNGNLGAASSVKYATANSTAVAPGDYTAKALTTLSFTAGQRTKTVSITIRGDTVVEAGETFSLVLSSPVGAAIADGVGVGTIVNDD